MIVVKKILKMFVSFYEDNVDQAVWSIGLYYIDV